MRNRLGCQASDGCSVGVLGMLGMLVVLVVLGMPGCVLQVLHALQVLWVLGIGIGLGSVGLFRGHRDSPGLLLVQPIRLLRW